MTTSYGGVGAPGTGGQATAWSATVTYGIGAFVIGSDNHTYVGLTAANINHDPTTDGGTHWHDITTSSGGGSTVTLRGNVTGLTDSGALTANNWTAITANHTFTLGATGSLVQFSTFGAIQAGNLQVSNKVALDVEFNSGGTPVQMALAEAEADTATGQCLLPPTTIWVPRATLPTGATTARLLVRATTSAPSPTYALGATYDSNTDAGWAAVEFT